MADPETPEPPQSYSLSSQQRELLALFGPLPSPWRVRISFGEPIDLKRFAEALYAVRQRHEILRSSFVPAWGHADLVQRIHDADAAIGIAARPSVDDPASIELEAGALAADAHSWNVIARELLACYFGKPCNAFDFPVQYVDYVAWQEDILRIPVSAWPADLSSPAHERRRPILRGPQAARPRLSAKLAESKIAPGVANDLRTIAMELGVSESTILLGLWTLFAGAHAGTTNILYAVDGRDRARAADAVGLYTEWHRFSPRKRAIVFRDYICECGKQVHSDREKANYGGSPTAAEFDEAFAFEWIALDPLAHILEIGEGSSPACLRLRAAAGSDITLTLAGDPREWNAEASRLLLDRFLGVMDQIAREPMQPIATIRWIGDRDREHIGRIATSTVDSVPPPAHPHELFASIARQSPAAPAWIASDGVIWTYEAISERVRRLTEDLQVRGLRDGDLVALALDGVDWASAILAVWSCGAAFMTLPPGMAEARRTTLAAMARPRFWIRHELAIEGPCEGAAPRWADTACLAFTSGSTGVPRCVPQPYAAVAGYLTFVRELTRIGPGDVVLQLASPDFDASMRDSIGPLTAGAAVAMAAHDGLFDAELSLRTIQVTKATALLSVVPSVLRTLVVAAERIDMSGSSLRAILCAGEPLFWDDVHRARRALGDRIEICNLYGPTECTMTSTFHRVGARNAMDLRHLPVPIGRPIPHARCVVLDADLQLAPVAETGEIYIGGLGLAPAYLGQPQLTAERFLPEPGGNGSRLYRTGDLGRLREDGVLEFVGRVDDQVKIRGVRVEPSEVAAVLAAHPRVSDAAVLADRAGGEVLLRAFAALKPDPARRRPRTPLGVQLTEMNDYETDFFYQRVFVDRADFSTGISLRPDDIVLDVGANIGLFTLFIAQFCPGVRIHAFEPIPEIFAHMSDNTRALEEVRLHREAIGREPGRAVFEYYPASSCQSGRYPDCGEEGAILRAILRDRVHAELGREPSQRTLRDLGRLLEDRLAGREVECGVTTISDIIKREQLSRIDLLKIDVEKSELDVLFGILPEHWPKIEQIAVEVHAIGNALDTVTSLLADRGFDVSVTQEPVLEKTCVFAVHARRAGRVRGPFPLPPAAAGQGAAERADSAELLAHLGRHLPSEAVPGEIVILPELPRTARGKLDRDRLLAQPNHRRSGQPPGDRIEEVIADIWDEILGRGPYSRADDFFDMGGHSLSAMRLAARLSNVFGVALPLRELFEQRSIRSIADGLRRPACGESGARESRPFAPVHAPRLALAIEGELDPTRLAGAAARVFEALDLAADVVELEPGANPDSRVYACDRCVIQSAGPERHMLTLSFPRRRLDLRSLGLIYERIFDVYGGAPPASVSPSIGRWQLSCPSSGIQSSAVTFDARLAADLDLFVQDYGFHRGLAVLGMYAAFVSSVRSVERLTLALPNGDAEGMIGHGGFTCIEADASGDPSFLEYVERIRDALIDQITAAQGPVTGAVTACFVSNALPASVIQSARWKVEVADQCEGFSECCLAMLRSPGGIRLTLSHSRAFPGHETLFASAFAAFAAETLASPNDTLPVIAQQLRLYNGGASSP